MSRSTRTKRIPTHPGEVLLEEFLVRLEITQVNWSSESWPPQTPIPHSS